MDNFFYNPNIEPITTKDYIGTNTLWHNFMRFMEKYFYILQNKVLYKDGDFVSSKKKYKELCWDKVEGYDAIVKAENFIKNNPKVVEVHCDDNVFAGSSLFLIPHENKINYVGTSVVFIPQCTTDKNVFFLYPNHLNQLIKELQKIKKRQDKKSRKFLK